MLIFVLHAFNTEEMESHFSRIQLKLPEMPRQLSENKLNLMEPSPLRARRVFALRGGLGVSRWIGAFL